MSSQPATHAEAEQICNDNLGGYLAKIGDDDERAAILETFGTGLKNYIHIGNDPDNNDPSYNYEKYDGDHSKSK